MTLVIDHLIICVGDLETAASQFEEAHGLASVPGGRHPGHGTANQIVPLGTSYLELVAVVEPDEIAFSAFGTWVRERAAAKDTVDALCLRTDDLDDVCRRLGLEPMAMTRARADGSELSWRVAGLDLTITESLPFFIQWEVPEEDLPGRTPLTHSSHISGVEVTISGDPELLSHWMDGGDGVKIVSGDPGILSVTLLTDGGDVTL